MNLRTGLKLLPVLGALAAPLASKTVRSSGNQSVSEVIAGVAAKYQHSFVYESDKAHFTAASRDILEQDAEERMQSGFPYLAAQSYLKLDDLEKAKDAYEKFVEQMEADEKKAAANLDGLKEAYTFLKNNTKVADIDLRLKEAKAWRAYDNTDYDSAITLFSELGDEKRVNVVKADKAAKLSQNQSYVDAAKLYEEIGETKAAQNAYTMAAELLIWDETAARELFGKAGLPQAEIDAKMHAYKLKNQAEIKKMMQEAKADEPARAKAEKQAKTSHRHYLAESLIRAESSLANGDFRNAYYSYISAGWTDEKAAAKVDPLKRKAAEKLVTEYTPEATFKAAQFYTELGDTAQATYRYRVAADLFRSNRDLQAAINAYVMVGDTIPAAGLELVLGNEALNRNNCGAALAHFRRAADLDTNSDLISSRFWFVPNCAATQTFEKEGWRGEDTIRKQLRAGGISDQNADKWLGYRWLETDPSRALSHFKDAEDCSGILKASERVYKRDMTDCLSRNGFWNVSECSNNTRNLRTFEDIENCL